MANGNVETSFESLRDRIVLEVSYTLGWDMDSSLVKSYTDDGKVYLNEEEGFRLIGEDSAFLGYVKKHTEEIRKSQQKTKKKLDGFNEQNISDIGKYNTLVALLDGTETNLIYLRNHNLKNRNNSELIRNQGNLVEKMRNLIFYANQHYFKV